MKKFISIIFPITTILAVIVVINSCRQQDENPINDDKYEIKKTAIESKKNADSLQQSDSGELVNEETEYIDPPPKNGGQWKTKY
ncbi:hypothetical protein [Chryseobacterium sp. 2987]|uniref:hypothetical protein n=1 Tax=Chryseobacterium sp. 2987 TaxID=2817767 RepID=UPI0028598196|nr:hypothetical protein [Chryseobacterium sp. 2987]MDR6919495.1 hypothetical protein [Chryseobacterium sp. 2987]